MALIQLLCEKIAYRDVVRQAQIFRPLRKTVSYTHLTLPTIVDV